MLSRSRIGTIFLVTAGTVLAASAAGAVEVKVSPAGGEGTPVGTMEGHGQPFHVRPI